ncbi:U4/U6 small nuclear ribonucleoprotein Prp4 [Taenia solium]|eukprot:TsM_000644600 transcript=TsM_000644600 gene=TsM_000644600
MEATEDSFAVAQRLGHINVSQDDQYLPLEHRLPPAEAVALESIELKKKARLIQVSTEDMEVKYYLRQLGEPICLFGEDGADRRERLRMFLAVSGGPAQRPILDQSDAKNSTLTARDNNTVWYHQGPEGLAEARMWIAKYSLAQAKQRLEGSKRYYASVPEPQRKARYQEYLKILRSTALLCSQVGDARPLTCCRFSPDGEMLATTSLSGLCRLWSVTNCELQLSLRGHQSGACCIAWHPQARLQPNLQIALASSAQDGSVKLWSLDNEEPLADIEGHEPYRVSRIAFHPSGRFLGTTCFDSSWRLWDLEVCVEILHQEGHSKPVYDIAFHPDGSLALTAGLDSYGRVWDLRTGRCIMFLEGHLEEMLGVDIAANGYHAASSSAENCVRIWDLRQQQTIYVIPAHTSVVSSVKFEPGSHNYLVTSSFDKTIKLWGHPLWSPIRTLEGHSGRCVYADISPDKKLIASASHDLTFKLWSPHTDEHN